MNSNLYVMKCGNDEYYSTINLWMLFDVFAVIFAEVSIDNDKNIGCFCGLMVLSSGSLLIV